MSLAERLRKARKSTGLSLDELATNARISKTYLWELEKDTAGEKKPSADVLLRIASALDTTIADLLGLPTAQLRESTVVLPQSLKEFRERMKELKKPLSEQDVRDLAAMKFRGGRPQTADEWHQLYLLLTRTVTRKRTR